MKKLSLIMISLLAIIAISCDNQPTEKTEKLQKMDAEVEKEVAQKADPVAWSENANIYEVNIRQYTPEGTFNAFAKELPRLKKMGVDILWLMPIHPIGEKNRKGGLGSYYAVRDYTAVNPEFGTMADLKALVKLAHSMQMHVLIDWVANHTSWDNVWLENHEDFYEKDSTGAFVSPFDWSDVIALDYNNQNMRNEMRNALQFWLKEADIDGYRCDVAGEVPTDFWNWVRPQLEQIKPVFMLAEAEKPELLVSAFDMDYGWEFHHILNDVAKGKKAAPAVWDYLAKEKSQVPNNAYRMYFITNHDENSWNGTIKERMGDAADALALLTYTLADMPLLYSGQEAANEKRLEFFEKDVIDWKDYPKQELYTLFAGFKHDNPALWNGKYGGEIIMLPTNHDDKVMAFKRIKDTSDVMVLINLSDKSYTAEFVKDNLINYKPLLYKNFAPTMQPNSFEMMPWGYIVLRKQ